MMKRLSTRVRHLAFVLALSMALAGAAAWADGVALDDRWSFTPGASLPSVPEVPAGVDDSIPFVLDDGSAEGSFGVGGSTAQQFLWFNQFDLSNLDPLDLDEIWVQFPAGANMAVGNAIELVVYHDDDDDPANGATLLATIGETIQVVDGATFSIYPLNPVVEIPAEGNLLVGVVSRFVTSGVTSPTEPAAIDTSPDQGRSWLAVWTGDPPPAPTLPPDALIEPTGAFVPGNWMIRAVASPQALLPIPTLQPVALVLLVLILGAAGMLVLRRQG